MGQANNILYYKFFHICLLYNDLYFLIYYQLEMSQKDRSFSGSKFGKGSNFGPSGMRSKQMVQSHIKSIMPSLRGGKADNQIKYVKIRVQEDLEHRLDLQKVLKDQLNQFCGSFYDYKVFKDKQQILKEDISETDLFYIFLKEDLASWGEKFSRQQFKQSDGKKSIVIVQFLKKHIYDKKIDERKKLIQKTRRDPNQKSLYYVNLDGDYKQEIDNSVFVDMDTNLKNKLLREGDRVKTWAISNKYKQKKAKREKLYIYIEQALMGKLEGLYNKFRNKNGFKWTQINSFKNFTDLMRQINQRQVQYSEQQNLVSSLAIPVSKIFDKTQSVIKSMSIIGPSTISSPKSARDITLQKSQVNLPDVDKNFIIHSSDFEQADKIYQYVMGPKENNWQRVIYEDKNYPKIAQIIKQVKQHQKDNDKDQYMRIINAQTLYILTFQGDAETDAIYAGYPNIFNNRYLLDYSSSNQLITLLNQYSRNEDNFTIVIFQNQNCAQDIDVQNFIKKNQLSDANILLKYKYFDKNLSMNQSLSMNSKVSNYDQKDVEKYLRAVFEDRDRNFDPFECYGDSYVYLVYRYDKEYIIDNDIRQRIANSARLKKAPYQDGNYLQQFLKSIQRGGDHAIILTQDDNLREAQDIAKKFDNVSIFNTTSRKKVKDQAKVLAWGNHDTIKNAILGITDKLRVTSRKKYAMDASKQIWFENNIPRKLPKKIQFKDGNNVTVKLSSQQTHPDSEVMQQNLNAHFKQQIRIQNYKKPNQIRLVNKLQQPLTFIICRDERSELEFMKSIAKQQRDDIRQEYILYAGNPQLYSKQLFGKPQYQRFRFISNSWKKIEQYIIGVAGSLVNPTNSNDEIYDDELIHVFYHPNQAYLKDEFIKSYGSSAVLKNIRFHDISELEWTALQQSPHHLYYLLVNQDNQNFNSANCLRQIQRVEKVLASRSVAPKNMKMLVYGKKPGTVKDIYTQATFGNYAQALAYIAGTKLKQPKLEILKPYIFIDRNSYDWYYFLEKNKDLNQYKYFFIDNPTDAVNIISDVRGKQVGSEFWYLTNNMKDYSKFMEGANRIQKGRNIYGIYHGILPPGSNQNQLKFSSNSRQQIEAFLLNVHKRSQTVFSPQMLKGSRPIIAMSQQSARRIPIDSNQLQKWRSDLGAEQFYFKDLSQLSNLPQDRPVFLIANYQQSQQYTRMANQHPNLYRIVYDSNYSEDPTQNQSTRKKAHRLYKTYPNPQQAYFGFYPAQIRHYLRYLRYNIKNPPEKLAKMYPNQLTNVYLQGGVQISSDQIQNLYSHNHSVANTFSFKKNNRAELDSAINHALSFPNYNNLFVVSRDTANILQQNPNSKNINYIIYDEFFRKSAATTNRSNMRLLTDQKDQYVTYLFNLKQGRYDRARNYQSRDPLKVLVQTSNQKIINQINELNQIAKRNSNFTLMSYNTIQDLNQLKENVVVLVDPQSYKTHVNQLGHRENLRYFVLNNDRNINLQADSKKSQFFLTKQSKQLNGYFNNLRRIPETVQPIKFPGISYPTIVSNLNNMKLSRPLAFRSGIDLNKLRVYPQFIQNIPPPPPAPFTYQKRNIIDHPRAQIFTVPGYFGSDTALQPFDLRKFLPKIPDGSQSSKPETRKIIFINPISPPIPDSIPVLMDDKFNSRPDQLQSIPRRVMKPGPKPMQRKLAIIYPDNKQFKQIFRVLQTNLTPRSFSSVEPIPYNTQYDLQNLARNQNKYLGYDRTVIFLLPKMMKYIDELRSFKSKMKQKLQFYVFSDDFHEPYPRFKQFLSPYTIQHHQIPYINKQDPRYWQQTSHFNIMVPLHKKKNYNSLKSNNISILPYSDDTDIESQLHRNHQFVIIVCDKKKYHQLKKFTRDSPRCILVIQDNQQLKQDQVPLFRFPYKALYYGPDAANFLKARIPPRPIKPKQNMKVMFYKRNNPKQVDFAMLDDFIEYEKVPYTDNQDLFLKLIDKQFKASTNFKVPPTFLPAHQIRLYPKIYMLNNSPYRGDHGMSKFLSDYNKFTSIHQKQFKKSFKVNIKPDQYKDLPVQTYNNAKQLRHKLESDQTPCLVFLDINNFEHVRVKDGLTHKHLFIQMFDLYDIWIDRNGYLIPSQQLGRQQLALKQTLFTDMFNMEVFDTYNDMGFYYLSNSFKVVEKKTRNITFMTKEQLYEQFVKNPNILMVVFVQNTDRKWIPKQFYDMPTDSPKQPRVKLIFIHSSYFHSENILYIKYNQIDPVFYHINRVQLASRTDYCLFPAEKAGNVRWHRFAAHNKGFKPVEYSNTAQIDQIAQDIKGKFRKVHIICQKDDQDFISRTLAQYSIKDKPNSNEKLSWQYITETDNKSYMSPSKSRMTSNINFNPMDDREKFETVGHQVDIKPTTSNNFYKLSSGGPMSSFPASLQDIVQGKNFIINLNENLKDNFPVGNLYTNGVKYFKNINSIDTNNPSNQLIVTNQNLGQLKNLVQNNQKMYLVYVSNQMPAGQQGNAVVIKQQQIPRFIGKLQGIQRGGKNGQHDYAYLQQNHQKQKGPSKNIDNFKVVKLFYDQGLNKDVKKQILISALKNKNFRPFLFKDVQTLKKLVRQQGSLSLLLISKQPPNLIQELQKQNFTIVKNKRGKKVIVPKHFRYNIDGLSTILEQDESQLDNLNKQALDEHVDTYLTIMEKNPEKGRKNLRVFEQQNLAIGQLQEPLVGDGIQKQDSDKLNLHSNINIEGGDLDGNRQWIKQRLDGGLIILYVDNNQQHKLADLKRKYNILIQEYHHAINLNNSIRQKKDKFTIVLADMSMLNQMRTIKQQHPNTVFVLLNSERKQISPQDKANVSYEIARVEDIEPLIADIYDENEKIKYNEHGKSNSKLDNKKTSYVDNNNSWRLSTGYQNTRAKKAFVFYKEPENDGIMKKISNLNHITFVKYKDVADAQKKFNSHSGYQSVLIANGQDIPQFEDYIMKKKQQTYVIKLNPPGDYRENPKIRKNILLSAYSDEQVANFLMQKFSEHANATDRQQQRPKQGKSYAPRYQPNTFGTTPRFASERDYVPYKNDPIYSSRGSKSISRDSKVLRSDGSARDLHERNHQSPYYNR